MYWAIWQYTTLCIILSELKDDEGLDLFGKAQISSENFADGIQSEIILANPVLQALMVIFLEIIE